ncbi:class I SAM-dependent methyltransferase [Flagellimonas meridianipacifica]|uniref:Methyltransferase family protein n=1 Tax=Flagellimonas meridianipacifica TaxID=1080225 RepID=A0A2T0MEY4_9FLAO|nr:class I SAM-dependent methyltransferase [Allomuricauda pacifica]PRX56124.1 methyltransferase family protein [Allomuricauda pacifica]
MTDDKKEFIPALGHDWLTGFYDLAIRFTMPERKFRNKLMDFLDPLDGEEILEFGFGTGQNLILANTKNGNANYIGLDIDPKVKNIAKKKFTKNDIEIQLDLYGGGVFPYPDNTYDKVFSSLVFHQLDKEAKISCLNEICRVLKPDGALLIGDWGKPKSRLMRGMFYSVQILDGFATTADNVKGLIPDFMVAAGFENVAEVGHVNTKIGSYCYYQGKKPSFCRV